MGSEQPPAFYTGGTAMNVNIDFVGAVMLLRALIKSGVIGAKEGEKIARFIAAQTGASIVIMP